MSKQIKETESAIHKLEQTLQSLYQELGKQILDLTDRENHRINEVLEEIIRLKRSLTAVPSVLQCPSCFSDNDSGSRYCKSCGCRFEGKEVP